MICGLCSYHWKQYVKDFHLQSCVGTFSSQFPIYHLLQLFTDFYHYKLILPVLGSHLTGITQHIVICA